MREEEEEGWYIRGLEGRRRMDVLETGRQGLKDGPRSACKHIHHELSRGLSDDDDDDASVSQKARKREKGVGKRTLWTH